MLNTVLGLSDKFNGTINPKITIKLFGEIKRKNNNNTNRSTIIVIDPQNQQCMQQEYRLHGCQEGHVVFFGAFTKLREARISFVMSVPLSTWNSSAFPGRYFRKFVV